MMESLRCIPLKVLLCLCYCCYWWSYATVNWQSTFFSALSLSQTPVWIQSLILQGTTSPTCTYARMCPTLHQIISVCHKAQYFIFVGFCILLYRWSLRCIHLHNYECLKGMLTKFEIHKHCHWDTDSVLC